MGFQIRVRVRGMFKNNVITIPDQPNRGNVIGGKVIKIISIQIVFGDVYQDSFIWD